MQCCFRTTGLRLSVLGVLGVELAYSLLKVAAKLTFFVRGFRNDAFEQEGPGVTIDGDRDLARVIATVEAKFQP